MVGIHRYDPFQKLASNIDRLFGGMVDSSGAFDTENAGLCTWSPKADVSERGGDYTIRMDLPGMEQKDIQVGVENNILTISGERGFVRNEKEETHHRVECAYGRFSRSFSLPSEVDLEKIEAKYRNGVLELRLPRREETKPKQISIQIG